MSMTFDVGCVQISHGFPTLFQLTLEDAETKALEQVGPKYPVVSIEGFERDGDAWAIKYYKWEDGEAVTKGWARYTGHGRSHKFYGSDHPTPYMGETEVAS